MNKCYYCQQKVGSNSRFCPNCGKPLLAGETISNTPNKILPSTDDVSIIKPVTAQSSVASSKRPCGLMPRPLNAKAADAVSHTLFVVPEYFFKDMQEVLSSLDILTAKILSDKGGGGLVSRCQNFIRTSSVGEIKFVCIVGNWEDVPPVHVPNDILDDGDSHCLTDSYYGAIQGYDPGDPFTAIPEIPVGRIPVTDREIVSRIISNEPEIATYVNAFKFGVTAECWREATAAIVSSFPNINKDKLTNIIPNDVATLPKSAVVSSPQWTETALRQALRAVPADPFGIMLFNVHGSADDPHWVGEGSGEYVRIFEPNTVTDFNSALLISEACYGGAMAYDSPSIVEQFFINGGHSFVGSSTIAYGARSAPISGADLIAMHYVKCLYAGMSQGESLKLAKMEALTEDPLSREVGLKTALSFNLFGAPWQSLVRSTSSSILTTSATAGASRPVGSVLDRVRVGMAASPSQDAGGSLSTIRDQYLKRLPPINRQFILDSFKLLAKLHEFQDFAKISEEVKAWGGVLEDSRLDFVTAGDIEGYRLFCRAKGGGATQRLLIININNSGQLTKTVTSKGTV